MPASCTDRLQPLDLTVNRAAKAFIKKEFECWYAEEVRKNIDEYNATELEEIRPVDISSARMKCIGAQWLVKLYEYFGLHPDIVVNGFIASGITHSIDAQKPIIVSNKDSENVDNEDYSISDDYEANNSGDFEDYLDEDVGSEESYCNEDNDFGEEQEL